MSSHVDDYLVVGHDGHGVNSWAMHYYIVRGPLALFLQTGWGGAYMDTEAEAADMAFRFSQARLLVEAAESAAPEHGGRVAGRYIVVDSAFTGGRWTRIRYE